MMAEFCLECWNKLNNSNDRPFKYIMSKDLDLCEGCGKYKQVIVMERFYYYLHKFPLLGFLYWAIGFMLRLLILPYFLYIRYKAYKEDKEYD